MSTIQIANKEQPAAINLSTAKLRSFWAGLRTQQRIYLGAGLAITVAAVGIFATMVGTPDFKPLMTGLESADTQAIASQLAAKKITYQVSPDGTAISVPADQVDAARLEVASHDSPHSGRIGFEIFDKVSWGQTEFDEKVNYQRALEGELERTVQTISNVKSARVHLVMATDSVFTDQERGAKASVTLRLKRGSLSREELSAIARLVAGAVDNLKASDIAIIDADTNRSLGTGSSPDEVNEGIDQELTRRVTATLAPVVGIDGIHATVHVEYETSSSEENQEKYDPTVSAPLNMQHSEETIGPGTGVGGVPGTSSNVPKAKQGALANPSKESGQSSKTDSATYGVNRTTRHVIEPAGSIRRLTAAVLVDDITERQQVQGKWAEIHHKRSPEDMKVITELAQAAIGYDSTRGDVVSVNDIAFDRSGAVELVPPSFADRTRKGLNDYATIVRYAVLLILFMLVYLLMIRPIQRRALATPTSIASLSSSTFPDQPESSQPESSAVIAQRALFLKQKLTTFVRTDPESSTTAVRAWLSEEAP